MSDNVRDLAAILAFAPWFHHASEGGCRMVVHVTRMPTPREIADIPRTFRGLPVSIEYVPLARKEARP